MVTPNRSLSELGRQVRRLRHERGIKQYELAQRAGIATNSVARLETGRTQDFKGEVVCRLADVLGVSVGTLYGRREYTEDDVRSLMGMYAEQGVEVLLARLDEPMTDPSVRLYG